MFIKIQTTNSPHFGANGLIDAVHIAATAAAGTTPTPYNSAWYQSWKVIDNSVAGGMTSVHQSNYRTSTTSPSIRLVADCGLTSITGEKRQFDLTFNNYNYVEYQIGGSKKSRKRKKSKKIHKKYIRKTRKSKKKTKGTKKRKSKKKTKGTKKT